MAYLRAAGEDSVRLIGRTDTQREDTLDKIGIGDSRDFPLCRGYNIGMIEQGNTNRKDSIMTIEIEKLTDEQLSTICEKYGLRKPRAKDSPYHQVVRARAIRTATKDLSAKNDIPQKIVSVVSTNKMGQVDDVWSFEVVLKLRDKKYDYKVDVNTTTGEAVIK